MAYQLVFTSYPTSLIRGRSGFSTVARSADMPEKLASAVERLSAYSASSGVVYSHRILFFSNARWHVLSRTCDSGTDYTNRNNYIAHHIVVSDDEASSLLNPAEILLNWKGWVSSWSGEPRFIGDVKDLGALETKRSLPAKLWAEMFGDAGKAALLGASSACIRAGVRDAETLLALFSESMMAFVDSSSAWDCTFSTYAESGDDVLWKGGDFDISVRCVADISALRALEAPAGRAAEYARSGEKTNREKYNLTVGAYKGHSRPFEVVQKGKDDASNIKYYIASAIATSLVIICTLAYLFLSDEASSEESFGANKNPLPLPEPAAVQPAKPAAKSEEKTLLQTIEYARALIEGNKFSDAMSAWEKSPYAVENPDYAAQLLSDISARAQYLLNYAERTLAAGGEDSAKRASEHLEAVEGALNLKNLPKRESISKRLGTLKARIRQQ